MAVAFDAYTQSNGTGDQSWTHTPVGTPKGVLVFVNTDSGSPLAVSVTYGGTAMTEVSNSPAVCSGAEPLGAQAFFLGASIPTGNQTVAVTVTSGDTTTKVDCHCITITASTDTQVQDNITLITTSSSGGQVTGTLSLGGKTSFCAVGFASGYGAVSGITPLTNWTARNEIDWGAQTTACYTYDTIGSSDVTAGWSQTDGNTAAGMGVAVTEAPSNTDLNGDASPGSYSVTGAAATTESATSDTPITADAGAYALTGSPATTERVKIVTVKPGGGGDYTSLNSALSAEATNLVTAGYRLIIECYGGSTEDTTTASIAGFTTDATHYVHIRAATGEGHQGYWDPNAYTIHVTDGHCLSVNCVDLVVEQLQLHVEKSASSSTHRGVFFSSALSGTLNIAFWNCIAKASYSGSTPGAAIGFSGPSNASAAGVVAFVNCIAQDLYIHPDVDGSTYGFTQSATPTSLTVCWYNCLAIRCRDGFAGQTTVIAVNCYALECHNQQAWTGSFNGNSTNNASAGPPGETKGDSAIDIAAALFVDPLNDDFRLAPQDTALQGQGADLSADTFYPFDFDIAGNPRSGTWSIGPYDPSGDSPAQDVRWVMIGGVTTTEAVIKARMFQAEATADLYCVVSEQADLSSPTVEVGPVDATAANAYMATFTVTGLTAGTPYYFGIYKGSGGTPYTRVQGFFRTFPNGAANLKIVVWGDQDSGATDPAAQAEMLAEDPDLIICLGDYHYSDIASNVEADYWNAFDAQNILTRNMRLDRIAPKVFTWSDHDFQGSNSDGLSPNKAKVQTTYRKFFPSYVLQDNAAIYHSFVLGRLRFIVPDLRSERNSPTAGQIMSDTQMQWLKDELLAAREGGQIAVMVSECEWGGTAGDNSESWTGYTAERTEICDYLEAQGVQLVILTADAHMVAIDSGANMDFSTDGLMAKPPIVISCAPLEQNGTPGYGTYDQGSGVYEGDNVYGHGQYAVLTVTDSGGDTLDLLLEGRQGTTGNLVSYNPTLTPPRSMDALAGSYVVTGPDLYSHVDAFTYPDPGGYEHTGADLATTRSLIFAVVAGAYALTGVAAGTAEQRIFALTAAGAAYALTGADATTHFTRGLATAEAGAYALAGSDVTLIWDHVLPVGTGSYATTGRPETSTRGLLESAGVGAYALTGQPEIDVIARGIPAEAGVYTVSGAAMVYLWTHEHTASLGAYAVTGGDADTLWDHQHSATSGAYAVVGVEASALAGYGLPLAEAGTYALTGVDPTTAYRPAFLAGPGAYALTGQDASTTYIAGYAIDAVAGAYALTGAVVTPLWDHQHSALAGAYAITGLMAAPTRGLLAVAGLGTYAITGGAAVTAYVAQFSMEATAGAYAITGLPASLPRGLLEGTGVGTYSLGGFPSTSVRDVPTSATAGAYALTGQPASAARDVPVIATAGAYALTGAAAGTATGLLMVAPSGAYALTGAAVTPLWDHQHSALTGAYALTGVAAVTTWIGVYGLTADPGSYAVSGTAVTPLWDHQHSALAGTYGLTGADLTRLKGYVALAGVGAYALLGSEAVTSLADTVMFAAPGAYATTGYAATTHATAVYALEALAGTYAVTGGAAVTVRGLLAVALPGSYAVTGWPDATARTWELLAGVGAYAVVGTPLTILYHYAIYPTLAYTLPLSAQVIAFTSNIRTYGVEGVISRRAAFTLEIVKRFGVGLDE